MPALNLLHVLALASIAIVTLSSCPAQVNALVADRAQVARHVHVHDAIARRKRDNSATSRCKPRPSSTPTPTSTSPETSSPPPTSTSSSAPSTVSTGGSSNTGGKKMGLAWGENTALSKFALPNVDVVYNWSPDPPHDLASTNLQFCLMLWGRDKIGDFDQIAASGQYYCAMGMNEVNEAKQANLDPQDALELWMEHINPLKDKGYYLVSPSCTNDQLGLDWYQRFFGLCDSTAGCHVDIIAVHCYTVGAQACIDYCTTLYNTYKRPVWITEFADQNFSGSGGQPDMNQVWDFAGQMRNFINNTPWLEKAFPFGALTDLDGVNWNNVLMDANGNPTDLAHFYFG